MSKRLNVKKFWRFPRFLLIFIRFCFTVCVSFVMMDIRNERRTQTAIKIRVYLENMLNVKITARKESGTP